MLQWQPSMLTGCGKTDRRHLILDRKQVPFRATTALSHNRSTRTLHHQHISRTQYPHIMSFALIYKWNELPCFRFIGHEINTEVFCETTLLEGNSLNQ